MRKLYKFAMLTLSLTFIVSVLAFSVSVGAIAVASDVPTASTVSGVKNYAQVKTGNLKTSGLNSASFANLEFGYTDYTVTRADGSNYVELVSKDTMDTGKHFQFTPYAQALYDYDSTKHQYGVFDFDIATETDLTYLSFVSNIRKGQSTSSHTYTGGAVNLYFNSLFTAERDKFMHVTVIQDLTGMTQYVYVNNSLISQVKMIDDESHTSWKNGEVKLWPSFKLQMHHTYSHIPPLTENQTVLIDNLEYNYFEYNVSADTLSTLLSTGIDTWSERIYNGAYVMPEIPDAVEIDGVRYKNIYDANDKLSEAGGGSKEVTILRQTNVPIIVGCNATVHTNGYAFDMQIGYGKKEIAEGVYLVDNSTRTVSVKINGVEVCRKEVRPGTALTNIFGDETLNKTVIFGNGKLYKNVSWNGVDWNTPVNNSIEISGTGTEVTGYVTHDGSSIISTTSLSNALTGSSVKYVILGSDASLTSAAVTIKGTKSIYFNGHTLTQEDGSNHCFTTDNSTRATFYGPGVLNNMVTTTTYSLLFTSQGNSSSVVKFNDLTINAAQYLGVLRDGTVSFNNCDCNVFSAFGSNAFAIGEKSISPVTLSLTDTNLNFTQSLDRDIAVFRQVLIDTDNSHHVSITDSTITAQTTVFDIAASNSVTVDVSNSSLIASKLVSNASLSSATHGKINFLNNVNVNNGILNIGKVDLTGLTIVKSNNHAAPICYASSYATVTWWTDNTVEFWADGSIPTRNDAFIPVNAVEGGRSYVFDNPYKTAPFSLKGNLTLSSDISFNLYTTKGVVAYVSANGKTLLPTERRIDGVTYDTFTVKLSPSEAVSAFDVFFTLKDGNTVSRTISVVAYAKAALNTDSVTVKNLIVATLEYIRASALYFGINADFSEINGITASNPMTTHEIPTEVTNVNNGDISSYFSGAQLDLADTLKMRFNVKSGANITSLTIQINGRVADYSMRTSYVELNLRAYELSDVITITVNGIKKDYSLAEYLIGAKALTSGTTVSAKQCAEFFKDSKGNLASAIYNYSVAARAYKPVL